MSGAAGRVGLVLVSHSRALAEATEALARQMTGESVAIACAAGAGEGGAELGTDATAIAAALERVCGPAGAVVLMDLGSAILSAETALELVDPELGARTRLSGGPIVEGAVAAAVRAAAGGTVDQVAADARQALAAKIAQLGEGERPAAPETSAAAMPAADAAGPVATAAGPAAPAAPAVGPVAPAAGPAAPAAGPAAPAAGPAVPVARPMTAATGATAVATFATTAYAAASTAKAATLDVALADPNGLHARPAAQLIARAASFDAAITVENLTNGRGPVPTASLIALASLAARRGDVLRLRATGRQAAEAVEALAALLQREVTAAAPAASAASGLAIPVAPGVALGPLVRLERSLPEVPETTVDDPAAEAERLLRAIDLASQDLASALRGSDILDAHQALLRDPALVDEALAHIARERCNAAWAFCQAIDAAAAIYRQLEDPYLRAREADVHDVGSAVVRALLGGAAGTLPEGPPAVVVADDLTPSEAARLDAARVLGVIDRRGGPTSHAAILLRAAGIPAVAGAAELVPESGGARAGLDGATGEVWIDPDPGTALAIERRRATQRAQRASRRPPAARDGRVRLACGREIELWANVAGPSDARAAREAGAFGVGLLRTEMPFLGRLDEPGEDEQAALLADTFAVFAGAPIVVRTLDAGGDKALPYLALEAETNPGLGVRGVRLSLSRPAMLEAQLRAILVAGRGHDVRVLVPMVSTAAEVSAVRAALERAHDALVAAGRPHLWPVATGIMVEVPSAALMAERLARHVDFFSIGTNDLTQHTLAAERGHPRLHALADPAHPAVLRLVRAVVEAGHAAGRPVSVCGEAAADPDVAPLLVGLGVTQLSMCPSAFDAVEDALAGATFAELAAAAEEALAVDEASEARAARAAARWPG
ncbi:phosphoenolpyruvate--protein phosphotransferase [Sorangium sp. So ce1024]|uniref:phosphoenolpyruvate--protein phosphotransferase n=1 Tax=Sorangium sp. So ce1024 TaxID=3133327 RepID=UPI003F03578F